MKPINYSIRKGFTGCLFVLHLFSKLLSMSSGHSTKHMHYDDLKPHSDETSEEYMTGLDDYLASLRPTMTVLSKTEG